MADRLVEETRVQLLTVGHGTAAEQDFGGLLAAAGVGYGAKKIAEKRKRNQEQKQK